MDGESQAELLERYRENNCDLALALNDIKAELDLTNKSLLNRERELQEVRDENVQLKRDLMERDSQINTWRSLFIDLVQTNTRKYTEVMQKIGLVNSSSQQSTSTAIRENDSIQCNQVDALRRRRQNPNTYLPNLTEESVNSQFNETEISTTPNSSIPQHHITARRRVASPEPIPPIHLKSMKDNDDGEKRNKSSSTESLDSLDKENEQMNSNGRPTRKTAPKNLAEPKLITKLRRK